MKKYKIVFDKTVCIGAGNCVNAAPKFWHFKPDHKHVSLQDAKKVDEKIRELEIDEKDLKQNMEAAQGCPVNAIHIIDLETGKRII